MYRLRSPQDHPESPIGTFPRDNWARNLDADEQLNVSASWPPLTCHQHEHWLSFDKDVFTETTVFTGQADGLTAPVLSPFAPFTMDPFVDDALVRT